MATINWQCVSRWSEPDLNRLDVAVANLLCALGLPGASSISIDECRRTLDQWAGRVQAETARLGYLFHRQPGSFEDSEARFRMMVFLTVLQRDLGVRYDMHSTELSDYQFFSRPENLFIHGVLRSREGTCSSLPPTIAAVGRRLGYPLKLVTAFRHVFLRWEAPAGERFNVECTSPGLVSHPDIYYRHWPRRLSDDEVRRFRALQSLTPREEFALFIGNRGHVLRENYELWPTVQAYAHALNLSPGNCSRSACLEDAMARWERKLRTLMPRGFPPMTIHFPPREFADIPLDVEQEIFHQVARDCLLNDVPLQEKWWKPLKRDRSNPPRDLPGHISARFPQKPGETLHFTFAKERPRGYDQSNSQPA